MKTKRSKIIRRISALAVSLSLIMTLTACGNIEDYGTELGVDYGHSNIYTSEEIKAGVDLIMGIFGGFTGSEMHNIRYIGDNYSMVEYFDMMHRLRPELAEENKQLIVFTSDFHSSADPKESDWLEPDTEYRDFRWVLGRIDEKDNWGIINYGTDCLNE